MFRKILSLRKYLKRDLTYHQIDLETLFKQRYAISLIFKVKIGFHLGDIRFEHRNIIRNVILGNLKLIYIKGSHTF